MRWWRRRCWPAWCCWQPVLAVQLRNRERFEMLLRERDARHRLIDANIGDVVVVLDCDGVVTFVSMSVEAVLGFKPEEILGRVYLDMVYPDDVPGLRTMGKRLPHSPSGLRAEFRMERADGTIVWLEANFRFTRHDGRPDRNHRLHATRRHPPQGGGGRSRGAQFPSGGNGPDRRPHRPAESPFARRLHQPRIRSEANVVGADDRRRRFQGLQRPPRPPGRRRRAQAARSIAGADGSRRRRLRRALRRRGIHHRSTRHRDGSRARLRRGTAAGRPRARHRQSQRVARRT